MSVAPQQVERLPDDVVSLLRGPNRCFVATVMPDGSAETTETWVDTDGTHVVLNAVEGLPQVHNVRRDPRVSVAVAEAGRPEHYVAVRGRVVEVTPDGAAEHLQALARRYLGGPWRGDPRQRRLILRIAPTAVHRRG
ncbi:pyridoxamine 5'-phosphate oxidase family protein [Actinomycetospora cinnamomea]|uniref:PPOX class probable F420-dependent enzyme n=1 Tax=Actinomycetospora cinnamomea TaxID=663609 RepID=A0A2U1EYH0_9PSEU|nr:pyridoxamine 5'-phosphate oxidase family protein [Actinomycetospora cinnamomea]PVZ04987.1 PPOX class probable F420-dependent enzyme [Actinomycetospora cinnamomea]